MDIKFPVTRLDSTRLGSDRLHFYRPSSIGSLIRDFISGADGTLLECICEPMIASRAWEGRGGEGVSRSTSNQATFLSSQSSPRWKGVKKISKGMKKRGRELYSGTGGRLSFFWEEGEEASRWIEGETKEQRREMSEIRSPFLLENA